jgi:hypothetical protein
MPGGIHIGPSGSKSDEPEEQSDVRDDPHRELREAIGFIFEGLTEEEIEDRLAFYSLPGVPDPSIGLAEILSDDRLPLPPEEKVFGWIVPMLQGMLRNECKRTGDAKGKREAIAKLADSIVERLLDAACGGKTWGEQHARVLHRHPFALSDACSLRDTYCLSKDEPVTAPLSVKQAKERLDPLREFEAAREIEDLKLELKAFLPSKRVRSRKVDELCTKVKERFPELEDFLKHPGNIMELPPERAARIVWGARQEPAITEKHVSAVLAELRDRILFRTNPAQYVAKHRKAKSTPLKHENS